MRETWNIGNQDFEFGEQESKVIYFRGNKGTDTHHWKGLLSHIEYCYVHI